MAARHCRGCGIAYPVGTDKCRVCDQTTHWLPDLEPDEDWEAHVDLWRLAEPDTDQRKMHSWRAVRLRSLGFDGAILDMLAEIVSIPLDDVEGLILAGCSPDQATRILL